MYKILTILMLIGFMGVSANASTNQERGAPNGLFNGQKQDNVRLADSRAGHKHMGLRPMGQRRGGGVKAAPRNNFRNPYKHTAQRYWERHQGWSGHRVWNGHFIWNAPSVYLFWR